MRHDRARLQHALARAQCRLERRRAATNWFWEWCRKQAIHNKGRGTQPHLSTRVDIDVVRDVPALRTSPRRHQHVMYEDCLALEDEAFMLVGRLHARHADLT